MLRLGAAALLLVAVDVSAAASLLGDSKCSWGPAFWCSGLQQSAGCGATQHCIQKVWSVDPYPKGDDDEVCKICKEMITEARDQLESNETQEEIKQVFEGSCRLIPITLIAEECVKLADEFIVELVDTLASELDPETICVVSGLCSSGRIDALLEQYHGRLRNVRTDCDVCREQTEKMSLKVRLMDKDEVLDKTLEVCGRMSSFSDACKMAMLDNFDVVYGSLTHLGFVCDSSAICSDSFRNVPATSTTTTPGSDLECEFCEKVIQHWLDEWKANATMDEFKEALEAVCRKLGQPERIQRCMHIVDDYYIPAFEYFLNSLKASDACAAVGLCGRSAGFMEVDPSVPISVLLPHDAPPEQKKLLLGDEATTSNVLIGGYFAPRTYTEMKRPGCAICEFVLWRFRDWLRDEHTQDEMEEALNAICSAVPSSLKGQCDNLVSTYGPAVVRLIVEGVDPNEVCPALMLCDRPKQLLLRASGVVAAAKEKDEACATCEYVAAIVMGGIADRDNEDEVRNVLDSVCSLMPSSLADRCESFVNAYAEEVMRMIAENLTPDEICQGIQMCERKKVKDEECVICEYVISTLDNILKDKTNQDEIQRALEQVCGYLPNSVSKECTQFVDQYTEEIVNLLVNGATPEELCTGLGLCKGRDDSSSSSSSSSSEESSEEVEGFEGTKEKRPFCLLCQYVIGELDQVVEDRNNEEELKSALDSVCYRLSKPITKECLLMVDKYMDEIVEMFANDYTPEKVCSALHLCKKEDPMEAIMELSNDVGQDFETNAQEVVVGGSKLCTLCEFGVSVLENNILNNRTLDVVERAVLMLCSHLPGTVADECEDFVDQYGEQLIHLIVDSELSPQEVCSVVGVCSDATDKWDASSVGGHRCDWGPAFWCQSAFHAEACGTAEYCRRTGQMNF